MSEMETSLKALLPRLGEILDLTEDSLYERQRELVRCGLLPSPTGRGPGNGTPATLDTVSILLAASIVMSDSRRNIKYMTKEEIEEVAGKIKDAVFHKIAMSHVRDENAPIKRTVVISAEALEEVERMFVNRPKMDSSPSPAISEVSAVIFDSAVTRTS